MYPKINTLFENEQVKEILTRNENLVNQAAANVESFRNVLKDFVINHPEDFLGETLDETYKNIRLFTEVATAQYVTEITALYEEYLDIPSTSEDVINEYL